VRPLPALRDLCVTSAGPGISQTVPFAAREQRDTELVRLVGALLAAYAQAGARNAESASAQTGARNVETALDNLLALPTRVLAGRTRADARRTRAWLERLHDRHPRSRACRPNLIIDPQPPRTPSHSLPHPSLPRDGKHLTG
jgi:hypothetical protein